MSAPTIVVKLRNLVHKVADPMAPLGPLLVRLVIGTSFMINGWGKLHSLDNVTEFFASLHIPAPHFNAVLVACTECFGGALLVVGLLTRIAAIPLIISMAVAILTAKLPKAEGFGDFIGFEELAYLVVFFWLAVAGPGKLSLDYLVTRKWFKEDTRSVRTAA